MAGFFDTQFWVVALLVGAMIFVNGWTDAPNAVATCVASGVMPMRRAVNMSAVCNFLGLVGASLLGAEVADEIISSIPQGQNTLALLCSAMISVVAFASIAAYFGIPTSESHALVAAISGATVATHGYAGFSARLWALVALGIVITGASGCILGYALKKVLDKSRLSGKKRLLCRLEIAAAAALSFIHGAQDGQKFSAVMILSLSLAGARMSGGTATILCAAILALGTAVGGKRIIKKVGSGITTVDEGGGVCCDAAAFVSVLFCTVFGMPVSTTQTKTSAVLGLGFANGRVSLRPYYEIFSLWLLTFPVCFALSYAITRFCI